MTDLQTVRNAYVFIYGSGDDSDPGVSHNEAEKDFDEWLDRHSLTQIRRYLTGRTHEISRILGGAHRDE